MTTKLKKLFSLKKIQVIFLTIVLIFYPLLIIPKEVKATGGYKVPHVVSFNGASTIGANYYPIVHARATATATEAEVQFYVPKAGTFTGLSVLVAAANATGDTTVKFRKNGADGNNTVTIGSTLTGLFQDTTNSDSVSAGDLINMQITYTAGTITLNSVTIFFEASDGSTTQFLMAASALASFATNNTTRYTYPVGNLLSSTTEPIVQNMINHGSVASNFGAYVSANARTTNTTFRFRKNAGNGNQSVVFGSGVSGLLRDTSNTDSITAGDLVNFSFSTLGSGGNINIRNFQITLVSDNPQQITFLGASAFTRSSTASSIWISPIGGLGTNTSTETQQKMFIGSVGEVSKFGIYVSANASNRDMSIRMRISGTNGNNDITNLQGTTGWFQDTTNTDTITSTDTIAIRSLVTAGGTGTGNVTYNATTFLFTLPASATEQSAYRFFANNDSTDVGTALASQDTAGTISVTGGAFRLRLLLHISNANLTTSGKNFKLQFAQKSGTCDTGFSGETYADVTGATAIAYNNNASPTDGDNLTSNANDPTHSADTIVNQDYEELNNFTNSVSTINTGQDGKWDFSLIDNGAPANTSYCFRVVESGGTLLDTYSVIPEITTSAGGALSVDIVDAGGTTVGSPSVGMNGANVSFVHQTATGTFGTTSQKVRVDNGTGTATWTLSLAADAGATAFWNGTTDYDFNDPTANAGDGGDADSLGGRMTLNPGASTITPEGGCTLTNISSGSSSSYSEGVTDAITLASAASGADTNCYWDITGIGISQTIPAEQPADSYSINMTLSIIAS